MRIAGVLFCFLHELRELVGKFINLTLELCDPSVFGCKQCFKLGYALITGIHRTA